MRFDADRQRVVGRSPLEVDFEAAPDINASHFITIRHDVVGEPSQAAHNSVELNQAFHVEGSVTLVASRTAGS